MKTKRILSVILSLVMILSALPLTAISSFAYYETFTSGDWSYQTLSDGTIEIYNDWEAAYTGNETDVVIPTEIDGYKVTSVGYFAFRDCNSIKTLTIPDGVRYIDSAIVCFCNSLESISIPSSVNRIAGGAFVNAPLLKDIIVDADNENYSSENGVLFNKEKTLLITYADGKNDTVYTIPDSVKTMNTGAFGGKKALEKVIMPDSLECISDFAFKYCTSIKELNIGKSVTEIAYSAFFGCSSLSSVSIPNGVTTIRENAFANCPAIKSVTIPSTVTELGIRSFGYMIGEFHTEWDKNANEYVYYYDLEKIDNFIIKGQRGTAAERYAKENGFTFVEEGSFPDVPKDQWFYDAVKFNVEKGYFKGYENGNFGPANNIQRQDFVVVLSRIAGVDLSAYEGQNGGMSDVPKNDYYSAAVAWAVDNNIITGYKNGKFGVGDPITREQVCAIFYRYMQNYCGKDMTLSKSESAILARFGDKNAISDWAVPNVAWAVDKGVISGTQSGNVNPAGNANRAEISKILMNMSNNGLI